MAIQTRSILKSYFETGDKPTQQQFANLIDSMAMVTDAPGTGSESIPVATSMTAADVGKLAMLDYDGIIKVYHKTPAIIGIKGKWKIKFLSLSQPYASFAFADDNGKINVLADAWNSGAATPEDEAAAFLAYINSAYSPVLTATAGINPDEVLIEQVSTKLMDQVPITNTSAFIIHTETEPSAGISSSARRICVGVIKSVNETEHTAVFDDIIVLPIVNAPDVLSVLGNLENAYMILMLYYLMQLVAIPTDDGKVRAITTDEIDSGSFALNSVYNLLYIYIKPHADPGKYYFLKRGFG
ncbi:MAG: hypothetical protein JWN78_395 [Bacteroidota bacterium]|nr:hypothetical protein [Bacteroidota bacterium]